MSIKSQTANMRNLARLLSLNLSYDGAENKKSFLSKGRAFLQGLKKDLGLAEAKVSVNPGGIAVSGDCSLMGTWTHAGIYVNICQYGRGDALLYREARHMKDYAYGRNRFLTKDDLQNMTYEELLTKLLAIKDSPLFSK